MGENSLLCLIKKQPKWRNLDVTVYVIKENLKPETQVEKFSRHSLREYKGYSEESPVIVQTVCDSHIKHSKR